MVAAAVAGIAAAGAIGSSVIGSSASKSAAQTAASAQDQAAQVQATNLAAIRANEQPFVNIGGAANQQLWNELAWGQLGQPMNMTEAQLQQTPGYQFTLNQGLQSTQNAAAARGLGVSGAALKGAAAYTTGLADQTYTQQLQNYWANQNNRYNMLSGLSTTGANAAAQLGTTSTSASSNIGNALVGAGTALSQGQVGSANALTGGITNTLSSPQVQNYLQSLAGGSGGSTIGSGSSLTGGYPAGINPADLYKS